MAKKSTKIEIGIARTRGKADAEIGFLIEKYMERHQYALDKDGALDLEAILDWAFNSGIYRHQPTDPKTQLRRRVRRHLGHRYRTTTKGRSIRALVAVPIDTVTPDGVKRTFRYFPTLETEAHIIESGLRLRHGWAFKRVEQIENDRLGYNEDNIFGATIEQFSFNFDVMLKRSSMPTSYPKKAPDDLDEDDDSIDDQDKDDPAED